MELRFDVVQGNVEGPHTQGTELVELGNRSLEVGIRGVADVVARRQCEGKVNVVGIGPVDEFLHAREVVATVEGAPLSAQQQVVLGRVDVGVHLMAAVEGELVQPRLVRPWDAVEAFDATTDRHERPVTHRYRGHFVMTHELAQSLHSIESAPSVLALKGDDVITGTTPGGNDVAVGWQSGGLAAPEGGNEPVDARCRLGRADPHLVTRGVRGSGHAHLRSWQVA